MKKVVLLVLSTLFLLGCENTSKKNSVIKVGDICRDYSQRELPEQVAAEWDSMNAAGGYLLIRGAERNLDTLVNHTHLIFITEP